MASTATETYRAITQDITGRHRTDHLGPPGGSAQSTRKAH